MPAPKYVVLGAGGHAKVVIAAIQAAGGELVRVLDDDRAKHGKAILGFEIEGPIEHSRIPNDALVVVAVGSNRARCAISRRLRVTFGTVVHPSAIVHDSATLGPGSVVFAGAIVQPDVRAGAHVIVNTGASVDHDCVLGDCAHVGPGARLSGGVTLADGVLMGIGSCAIPGVHVGAWTTVGAGSAVIGDLPGEVVAVGVPAKPIGERH